MVSHSHLSERNSPSSPSRDMFAEYGVSNPNSPKMVESEALPLVLSSDSTESDANSIMNANMGLGLKSDMQEIFKAAQHFSRQDRLDVVDERKKNQSLMEFISAHGFSMQEVNEFSTKVVISKKVDAHNLFVKSPQLGDCSGYKVFAPAIHGPKDGVCYGSPSKPFAT